MRREVSLDNEILRGVVGSTCHGTAIDGQDDRDEMGIFIEPPENVCGLSSIDHYIYRDQPEGMRSQPGDLDLTMFSLRKFCKLAVQGNPSVITLLWLPFYITKLKHGAELVEMRKAFISKESGKRFLGYLTAQKKGLMGERSPKVSRPELIEMYGYDTKFAMHALRLGYQGIELLEHHNLALPVVDPDLTILRKVRTGQYTYEEVLDLIDDAENKLRKLVDQCDDQVDIATVNNFLVRSHREHWG